MKTIRTMVIAAAAFAAACGGSAASPDTTAAAQAAAKSYEEVGQNMAETLGQYQTAAAAMADHAACQVAEASYEARMGAMIDRMQMLSGTMDGYMAGAMGGAAADMGCVAAAMRAEYERHRAVACTDIDVAPEREEARHHGTTMAGWIEHQRVRYEQMGEAMGITPPTGDATWTCVHHPDGTFTMDGHHWAPPESPAPGTPPAPTPGPGPQPWPMPCGGTGCPCGD